MAGSVSGQDQPNRALWLATREGKVELCCPLGITCLAPREKVPRKPNNKSFKDPAWGRDGWILASFFFFANLWTSTRKKKLGQYPAILSSRLLNNPYLLDKVFFPFQVQSRLASSSYESDKPSFCPGHCWRQHYADQGCRRCSGDWAPWSEAKRWRNLISYTIVW